VTVRRASILQTFFVTGVNLFDRCYTDSILWYCGWEGVLGVNGGSSIIGLCTQHWSTQGGEDEEEGLTLTIKGLFHHC
jgi:hypothetical protein